MTPEQERKHAELSEMIGLLRTHRDTLAEASGWNSAHVDEVLIAARKVRDALAQYSGDDAKERDSGRRIGAEWTPPTQEQVDAWYESIAEALERGRDKLTREVVELIMKDLNAKTRSV